MVSILTKLLVINISLLFTSVQGASATFKVFKKEDDKTPIINAAPVDYNQIINEQNLNNKIL